MGGRASGSVCIVVCAVVAGPCTCMQWPLKFGIDFLVPWQAMVHLLVGAAVDISTATCTWDQSGI